MVSTELKSLPPVSEVCKTWVVFCSLASGLPGPGCGQHLRSELAAWESLTHLLSFLPSPFHLNINFKQLFRRLYI